MAAKLDTSRRLTRTEFPLPPPRAEGGEARVAKRGEREHPRLGAEFTIVEECAAGLIPACEGARILGPSRSTPGVAF